MNYYSLIDHTLLKPESTATEIKKLCSEAVKHGFFSVCVNPQYISLCKDLLSKSQVKICTVIGFPLGASTTKTKVFEAKDAINNGANEIDMVINIGWLKEKNKTKIIEEIIKIKEVCGPDIVLKVIIETCLLSDQEKILACECVSQGKANFIKTSTGFSSGGATVDDVKLLRQNIAPSVQVKASGGIKTFQDVVDMVNAGATRIGTSKGVELLTGNEVELCNY